MNRAQARRQLRIPLLLIFLDLLFSLRLSQSITTSKPSECVTFESYFMLVIIGKYLGSTMKFSGGVICYNQS